MSIANDSLKVTENATKLNVSFKYERNARCSRKKATEAYKDNGLESVKNGYQWLLNKGKVNIPKFWHCCERDNFKDFVESLVNDLREGYTVRLGIKGKSNKDGDLQGSNGVLIDIDESSVNQTFFNDLTKYASFYYYTPSYVEGVNEKHRLCFLFNRTATNYEARVLAKWLYKYQYQIGETAADSSCYDPCRLFFPPVDNESIFPANIEQTFEKSLDVDKYFSIAENALSVQDLNDCKVKAGLNISESVEKFQTSTVVSKSKKSVKTTKTKDTTPESSDEVEPIKITDVAINHIIHNVLGNDKAPETVEDVTKLFSGFKHNFVEIQPDSGDLRQGALKCWTGLNPWTENSSGTSFKVSSLENGKICFVARGANDGSGKDKSGNLVNYWFWIFKDNNDIKKDVLRPEGKNFTKTVSLICETLEIPELNVNSSGKPKYSQNEGELYENLRKYLEKRVQFNELSNLYEFEGDALDFDTIRVFLHVLTGIYYSNESMVRETILYAGKANTYHPIRDWLEVNYQENKDRLKNFKGLDSLSSDYFGTEDNIYNIYMRKTLIAAISRVVTPGSKVDSVVVLQGKQGTLKSTFWRYLAGYSDVKLNDCWFNDGISFNVGEKDELIKINKHWFHELAEVDNIFRRKDISSLKSFLTTTDDNYRAPYGRTTKTHPRNSIFVGSVNPAEFLNDSDGDRRFWVIPVIKAIDIEKIKNDRSLLWAKAYEAYKNGEKWYLSPDEEKERDSKNSDFRTSDSLEESLVRLDEDYCSITTKQIYEKILMKDDIINRGTEMRISDCMKKLGWLKSRKTHNGKKYYVWVHPESKATRGYELYLDSSGF